VCVGGGVNVGVEGLDSCIGYFEGLRNWWAASQDCINHGGHLVTTRQTYWGQGGVMDQVRGRWSGMDYFVGGRRYAAARLGHHLCMLRSCTHHVTHASHLSQRFNLSSEIEAVVCSSHAVIDVLLGPFIPGCVSC
jgi:hypothetical protein